MFLGMGTFVFALLVSPVARWTARWAPQSRHHAMVLLAAGPLVSGAAALLSVVMPSLLGQWWPNLDHCLEHGGHSHLCLIHYSGHTSAWTGWAAITLLGAGLVAQIGRGGYGLLRAARVIHGLVRSARYDASRSLWVVASQQPLCVSVGLFRARLMVSEGLLQNTSSSAFAIISAHEDAHARRKDSLMRLCVRAATFFWPPAQRKDLLAALEAAQEQACDEHAAKEIGDRLSVAEAILAVERQLGASVRLSTNMLASGFGTSFVADRVNALLEPARERGASKLLALALVSVIALLLGSYQHVHHVTESVLAHLEH
jgi:hypothetical protein